MGRREKAAAMRTAILDAARSAFAENGFTATKLRDIAEPIGITQPLIHHYFASKQQLFDAVITRAFADYVARQKSQWERSPDDVRFFTEGIAVLFAYVGEQRELIRLFRWAQLEGRFPELPDSSDIDAKIYAKFVEAQQAGVLRANIKIQVAMLLIDGTVHGFWNRLDGYPDLLSDTDAIIEDLIDALLTSILSDEALAEARALRGR